MLIEKGHAIGRKYERDIDLLLAEEFVVSPGFAAWFLGKTKFSNFGLLVHHVAVSKSDNTGESDLVVIYSNPETEARYAIHIEDKIDAPMQPDQEDRYRQRAAVEMGKGAYQDFELVLCAPSFYLNHHPQTSDFDRKVSYEDIAAFINEHDPSPRGKYRAEFVSTATSKKINAWQKVDDEATNMFWDEAYKMASKEFPVLEMKAPELTKGSMWINFRPHDFPTMPRRVYVSFKGDRGFMDLTFDRCSAHKLAEQVKSLLTDGMTVHQTGQSVAIRLAVGKMVISDPLAVSLPKLREAFSACAKLIHLYRSNQSALMAAVSDSAVTNLEPNCP